MIDRAARYLHQGIETFKALEGRIVSSDVIDVPSLIMYDWRLPTVSVDVHGCAFSDRPVVIAYDARLEGKAMYIAVARQVLTLAPDYWSIVGRRLGNASELGRELDSMAYSVTQNGGREVLDELLKQHIFEK